MGIAFCKESKSRLRRTCLGGCVCPAPREEDWEGATDEERAAFEARALQRARRREKCRDELIPECLRCYKNKALDDADVHEENYCFKCYRRRKERALLGPRPPKPPLRERCAYFWAGWCDPVVTFEVYPDELPQDEHLLTERYKDLDDEMDEPVAPAEATCATWTASTSHSAGPSTSQTGRDRV